eukprot:snap_masked-scaffold_7-processed-gene-2.31-mRNA-1 protein AED:1.00 eAED:1.00 QI:0/0/0/0/1/1/2/0/63
MYDSMFVILLNFHFTILLTVDCACKNKSSKLKYFPVTAIHEKLNYRIIHTPSTVHSSIKYFKF